jgi:hypothetical protein
MGVGDLCTYDRCNRHKNLLLSHCRNTYYVRANPPKRCYHFIITKGGILGKFLFLFL